MDNCIICNKKLKLSETVTNICKCKKKFCNFHFIPENHFCSYDYRTKNSDEIQKNNKIIVSDKITKFYATTGLTSLMKCGLR